jgi:hypothetical protein
MTLDLLDHAFLERWNAFPATTTPQTTAPQTTASRTATVPPLPTDFIGRLLDTAWQEWSTLADEIESARSRGRRAIAVVACERGAGCSTLIAALLRILRDRGRDAVSRDHAGLAENRSATESGPTHDKRIVLVDAGVWFPPGRIHRQRLMLASTGCDAAILVRKGSREAPASWGVALEAIGVEPLGEVISFATPVETTTGTGGMA